MYIIPFDSDNLKKIITGEIENPTIDYVNSKIKGKNFITYFSNLDYKNISIDFTNVSLEEKKSLLVEYIKHQSTVNMEQFVSTIIKTIFYFKGFDLSLVDKSEFDKEFLSKSIFTNDEIVEFVGENKKLVSDLVDILDGTLLYAIKNLKDFKENFGNNITTNVVVDSLDVGKTFVNMFSNETFNAYFYSKIQSFDKLKYFEHYFDRPIYSGKTLLSYITGDCILFPLLKIILEQSTTTEQIKQIYKETDVTSI